MFTKWKRKKEGKSKWEQFLCNTSLLNAMQRAITLRIYQWSLHILPDNGKIISWFHLCNFCNRMASAMPLIPGCYCLLFYFQEHMPGIKLMYTVGYSLSLSTLILAVAIMIYFRWVIGCDLNRLLDYLIYYMCSIY